MKINISLSKIFAEGDDTENLNTSETSVPEIDINRVKTLTLNKIQLENKRKSLPFRNRYTKIACALIAAVLITTGSVYAFSNEGFQTFISELTGVQQAKILTIGEAIKNKDYELKVHEIVTDSYVGSVVVSIEALREKSKDAFDNYRIDLKHIGSGFGLRELAQYREPYIKYYEVSFSGATYKDSHNSGKLQFSAEGMKKNIEVSLSPTVERVDMDIPEDNSNGYKYKFDKFRLSEIGLTLEGTDTRNMECEYWYNIELLFSDGTKELLKKKMNENHIETHMSKNVVNSSKGIKTQEDGTKSVLQNAKTAISGKSYMDDGHLISGSSERSSGDGDNYVYISLSFVKNLPLDTVKQVIINDIAYDIER